MKECVGHMARTRGESQAFYEGVAHGIYMFAYFVGPEQVVGPNKLPLKGALEHVEIMRSSELAVPSKEDDRRFVERLIGLARNYGWAGDYIEVSDFVTWVVDTLGFDSDAFELEPYDYGTET